MAADPAQNTCCSAAHSALAQVMITVDAFGSFPAGVESSVGAAFPTAPKFTTGNGGPSGRAKSGAGSDVASCSVMPKRAFGLWALTMLVLPYPRVSAIIERPRPPQAVCFP